MNSDPLDSMRICMVSHSFYESDNRITRYAEALAKRGDSVKVIALRRSPSLPRYEVINDVEVYRIQDRIGKSAGSRWSYLWPLLRFTFVSNRWLAANTKSRKFDLVHVHNIPDFLVFAAWQCRRNGSKIILDIHDLVPEFFTSKFTTSLSSSLARALLYMEKMSARMADHIILANHLWLDTYSARSANRNKCSVIINHVDDQIFQPRPPSPISREPLIIFPGGLQWHQGLDIAIRAFAILREKIPKARFHIYGDGNTKAELMQLADTLLLGDSIKFFEPLSLREIANVMGDADLGVVPKRADSFGNEAYSTKIMEFMSVGVPVVVSKTRVDSYYFDDSVVRFFESGNVEKLATAMFDVLSDSELRKSLTGKAREYVAKNSWGKHYTDYLKLVDKLINE